MGRIRFQTYHASGFLIERLDRSGVIGEMLDDGGDIILFRMPDGEKVSVHLIESVIPLYEIRGTLEHNAAHDAGTLFMLWASMLLPHPVPRFALDEWNEALCTLYGDTIYGYDMINGEVYIFPVHFHGTGRIRRIDYGTTVRAGQLRTHTVETALPGLAGRWRVADFTGKSGHVHHNFSSARAAALTPHYAVLGVELGDDRETIRAAYRLLARQYHPDTNDAPDAHDQMQQINAAYAAIMAALEQG